MNYHKVMAAIAIGKNKTAKIQAIMHNTVELFLFKDIKEIN